MHQQSNQAISGDVSARVFSKEIDLLYSNQGFALLVTSVTVILLFVFLSFSTEWQVLQVWSILFACAILFRVIAGKWYFYKKNKNTLNIKQSELIFIVGVILTGIVWAGICLLLFPILQLDGQILVLVSVLGFSAGSLSTLAFRLIPVYSFIILLLSSLVIAVNVSSFSNNFAISIALVCYLFFLFRVSTAFYTYTNRMLNLHEKSIDRENELLLQRERANAANSAKSEFLSRMSHELRTPLNAILGLSELQQRDTSLPLEDKQLSRSKKISDAGNHLLTIVNDVLDFSRVEIGKLDVTLEATNLYEVIQASCRLVENKASLNNVDISLDKSVSSFFVLADKNRLMQIIVNLLDNAIKYNRSGGNVSVHVARCENKMIRFSVIDTGYGLSDEDESKLFLPFARLASNNVSVEGAGIGLSLCKELVGLMKGDIGVDSRQGEGSCFWVELPQAMPLTNLQDNETQKVNAKVKINSQSSRILLVEDNIVNSEVAIDMLHTFGLTIDLAENGEEALKLFDINEYALILMDCEMPIIDGFSTTAEIRLKEKILKKSSTPIVALTAHAVAGAKEKCISSGMDDFLSKPFTINDLTIILGRWVDAADESIPMQDNSDSFSTFICDESILDCKALSALYIKQNKNKLLSKLITIYLQQSSMLLTQLDEAFITSDVEQVRKITHTLKSSSKNVGAEKLSELCRKIELNCAESTIDAVQIQSLIRDYKLVENALNDLVTTI